MNLIDGPAEGIQKRFSHRQLEIGYLFVFFTIFASLASLFPFSGDDWNWGSPVGIDRLLSLFDGLNGRYAGNVAVLLLVRGTALTPMVTAAVVTVTIYLVLDLTENRTRIGYSVITFLFLGMPQGMWRQSIVWVSGFANYALATLCMLTYLRAAKRDWRQQRRRNGSVGHYALIFVFGFCSQLFMEHVSTYLVVASIVYLVAYRLEFRAFSLSGICWFVAFLSGAVVMFSNTAYRVAASSSNNYQKIASESAESRLTHVLSKFTTVISQSAVTQNTNMNLVLVLLMCVALASARALTTGRKVIVWSPIAAFLVLTAVLRASYGYASWLSLAGWLGVAAALMLLALLATAAVVIVDGERRAILYICCGSVLMLVAPLTLVEPIGPRCFYPSYVIFLIAVSVLLKHLQGVANGLVSAFVPFVSVLALALLASDFWVYSVVYQASEKRLSQARAAVAEGATTVTLKRLPFKN
ncbi:MAG: hypothetical protein IMZ73_14205, partial [Chloroflexi bacterium]|nr:hypothetical protein [Chloroflexota bacterium]